jgi:acyl-CoA dehydrogenase
VGRQNAQAVGIRSDLRWAVARICEDFPAAYWRTLDTPQEYPDDFVRAMTGAGFLGSLIPERYGGSGLGLGDASVILEEVNHQGGNASAIHAQMYTMGTLLRHGSEAQKAEYLPQIARGEVRLQAFAVTEPDAGSDTAQIRTSARKVGDAYRIDGQKIFTSRVQHSDLMMLLARTGPTDVAVRTGDGLSVFLVDLRLIGSGLTIRPIRTMINHETNELFFDDVEVPATSLIGREGSGFRYLVDGLNAERILIAAECIGDGRWFIERATAYATERHVFGRPIGQNQGIQFPIAEAHIELEAADLMRWRAADLFDSQTACGAEANMAKYLAAAASWKAANTALQTFGGYGMAVEYDVERKFRETRLYQLAPISTNLILAYIGEHVLSMPRSY